VIAKGRETKDMFVWEGGDIPTDGRLFVGASFCFKVARKCLLAILAGVLVVATTFPLGAQSQAATAASPVFEYEVASIRLNISGGASIGGHNTPDSYSITNVENLLLYGQS
jgi:hypothetical protein